MNNNKRHRRSDEERGKKEEIYQVSNKNYTPKWRRKREGDGGGGGGGGGESVRDGVGCGRYKLAYSGSSISYRGPDCVVALQLQSLSGP